MFTEQSLRDHPSLVKAFMGIEADQFWELLTHMTEQFAAYTHQQRQRASRRRAVGAGRHHDLSLCIRTAVVLTYLRLHIPQATVAALFVDATQSDLSRDLRRLLPLIQQLLPCPVIWEEVATEQAVPETTLLTLAELAAGRVLVDATEQRVSRAKDYQTQKAYYCGKKHAHTLKTQVVSDGEHHLKAISVACPGAKHDKALSDQLQTLARLPTGCEADADKGYQELAAQVPLVCLRPGDGRDPHTAATGGTNTFQETQGPGAECRAKSIQSGVRRDPCAHRALHWLVEELGHSDHTLSL